MTWLLSGHCILRGCNYFLESISYTCCDSLTWGGRLLSSLQLTLIQVLKQELSVFGHGNNLPQNMKIKQNKTTPFASSCARCSTGFDEAFISGVLRRYELYINASFTDWCILISLLYGWSTVENRHFREWTHWLIGLYSGLHRSILLSVGRALRYPPRVQLFMPLAGCVFGLPPFYHTSAWPL